MEAMNDWKQLLFHFKLAELLFVKENHIGKEIRESRDDYGKTTYLKSVVIQLFVKQIDFW